LGSERFNAAATDVSLSSESEKMLHSEESEEEVGNANGRGEN
jgi:hypothetical protein